MANNVIDLSLPGAKIAADMLPKTGSFKAFVLSSRAGLRGTQRRPFSVYSSFSSVIRGMRAVEWLYAVSPRMLASSSTTSTVCFAKVPPPQYRRASPHSISTDAMEPVLPLSRL
jgi:hypothetical protein